MNWRLVAIFASIVPIIIIVIRFDIRLDDVLAVGAIPFALAVLAMMVKLGLQGAKLAYIVRSQVGRVDSIMRISGIRIGSEFIKFTTPMFVGAEFVVIYWLHKRGVSPAKSMWVAILDIVTEVLAGGVLAMIAGVIALINGAYLVAAIILTTSVIVTSLWVVLFFLSSKRIFQIPRGISGLAIRIGKKRAEKYVEQTNSWIHEVCTISKENMGTGRYKKTFVNAFLLSLASWLFYGISFMIIAGGVGIPVAPFDSIMAVMGANAIGNLPITVGGSGLAEFGVVAYLNSLNPFDFEALEMAQEWNAVIAWRIATYYVPIAVTWVLLFRFALGRYTKVDAK